MEITYDLIIEYLTSSKNSDTNTNFPNKRNLMVNLTESCFAKYFNKNYYRYGVLIFDSIQNNISFFSSLLSLINNNFISLTKYEQNKVIYLLKDFILNKFNQKDFYKKHNFNTTGIMKGIIKEEIKTKVTPIVIQTTVEIFKINIIIFNFINKQKYIFYPGTSFDVFRPTILMAQKNDYFEPIIANDTKIFTINNKIIKKLMNKKFKYPILGKLEKKVYISFNLMENIDNLLNNSNINVVTLKSDNESNVITLKSDNESDVITLKSDNESDVITLKSDNESDVITLKSDNESDVNTLKSDNESDVSKFIVIKNNDESDVNTLKSDNESDVSKFIVIKNNDESDVNTLKSDNESDVSKFIVIKNKVSKDEKKNITNKYNKFTTKKLLRFKKAQLLDIAKELKININTLPRKTKTNISKEIMSIISN